VDVYHGTAWHVYHGMTGLRIGVARLQISDELPEEPA
jgi:hypothetical protein